VRFLSLIFFVCLSVHAFPFKKPRDKDKVIRKYNRVHRKFFRKACRPGEDEKFLKLFREYRGEGFFLPEYKEQIDIEAIKANIPHLKAKISWLKSSILNFKKKPLPNYSLVSEPLKLAIDAQLKIKKDYSLALNSAERKKIKKKASVGIKSVIHSFKTFMEQSYFLKSFGFPNDHLKNRLDYVEFKKNKKNRAANKKYLYRKIVEDGALDSNNTHPDKSLRSTMDTLALNIPKLKDLISEPIRYDLLFVLERAEKEYGKGKKKLLERLESWHKRSVNALAHYKTILKNAKFKNSENKKILLRKLKAEKELQNYVLEKQVMSYKYWAKQSELMKAIFTIETILFNEVGSVDGPTAIERKDVAKVVLNRYKIPFYQKLNPKQELYEAFSDDFKKLSDQQKWLNLLFRKGEFSFTYYYISGNAKIFCPDQSSIGRYLRRRNINIALEALWENNSKFKATRYFSRASMNGRIDMSSVWDDFRALEERPGIKIRKQWNLRKYFKGNKYQYLYEFRDPRGRKYEVVDINNKTYSVTWKNKQPVFYAYRNTHYFKYFVSRSIGR
jgi:hypothetical protein